ncbi:MAG: 4Fe-4S dicluster domain-containing protein [Thermomicrobiales bacterium]
MTPRTQATPVATPISPPTNPHGAGETFPQPTAYPAEPMGFFTDTTVCIGCKACEVACKSWNGLSSDIIPLSGNSYDNTQHLSGENWRHVQFIEQFNDDRSTGRWLLMSDVCKHCVHAGCLEVCPTGAIIRTEYDTVVIQADTCNGCRDCIAACPFGVIEINPASNTAMKCTLCYDRLQSGLPPACAQACPTHSIQFGTIADLKQAATARVEQLHSQNPDAGAYLYGADDEMLGGLNSFYLLVDPPETYGLPANPKLPTRDLPVSSALGIGGAVGMAALGAVAFRKRRMDEFAREAHQEAAAAEAQEVVE